MKKGFYIFLFLLICQTGFSQDVEFSQHYANPLYLNPAFAGSEEYTRIALNYRTLMPVSFGDYSTYSVSVDKYIKDLSGGVGLQVMNDRQAQGVVNELGINLIYAYNFRINHEWTINAGLKTAYQMNTVDARKLSMTDPESGLYKSSMFFDFSAGILSWYQNIFVGFAVDHLTRPVISLGTSEPGVIGRKYTFHGGMEIPFYNSLHRVHMTLSPNIIYQHQNASSKLNLGLYLAKENFTSGLWIKTNKNFQWLGAILMFGYLADNVMFAYSYDIPFNFNHSEGIISGAHEVTFLYFFKYKSKKRKIKAIKCPRF